MFDEYLTDWLRWLGGKPCFRIYGRNCREKDWRIVDVYATHRRDLTSRWPLWCGKCITWTSQIVVVGQDFAEWVLEEQAAQPATRSHPLVARCLKERRGPLSASEILAHECGHTWQARRMGMLYLPVVGAVTLFREGRYPWNYFENHATECGQFGGILD